MGGKMVTNENIDSMDLEALYDLWWELHDVEKAIEQLKSGKLRKVLDGESLPNCVDEYLEHLLKMVVEKMIKVNKIIEQRSG
jgi:hypothetical protein